MRTNKTKEAVDHPEHYGGDNKHEVIKCLRAWGLEEDALAWNAAKYIGRAYKKGDPVENFQKGAWYVLRRVAILEGKDPGFYNDIIKAAVGASAADSAACEEGHVEDPDRAELRRSGKRNCDAPDCEHEGTEEWEAFWLCEGHRELAPIMPIRILDAMRVAVTQAKEKIRDARGHFVEARGHFVEAGEAYDAKVSELEGDLVVLRRNVSYLEERNASHAAAAHSANLSRVGAVEQAACLVEKIGTPEDGATDEELNETAIKIRELVALDKLAAQASLVENEDFARVQGELNSVNTALGIIRYELEEAQAKIKENGEFRDTLLFDASQVVEKAYGRCRAATDIRAMGSEALRIRPIVDEAKFCLGCNGGSARHTCGKKPDASRCDRCFAMLSSDSHDCMQMGTPPDHYVTFLERELRNLRDVLVSEFGVAPERDGAVASALRLIRKLEGESAVGGHANGPLVPATGSTNVSLAGWAFGGWWATPKDPLPDFGSDADHSRASHERAFVAGAEWRKQDGGPLKGDQTPHQLRVERMMKGFGQEVPGEPLESASNELRVLRARLIMEECMETILGGLRVEVDHNCGGNLTFDYLSFSAMPGDVNMIELADGCADVSVVTVGTLSAFGVKDAPLLREVDANNQAKVDTATVDEFGKFVKHPDHKAPDIAGVLHAQGCQGSAAAMNKE